MGECTQPDRYKCPYRAGIRRLSGSYWRLTRAAVEDACPAPRPSFPLRIRLRVEPS